MMASGEMYDVIPVADHTGPRGLQELLTATQFVSAPVSRAPSDDEDNDDSHSHQRGTSTTMSTIPTNHSYGRAAFETPLRTAGSAVTFGRMPWQPQGWQAGVQRDLMHDGAGEAVGMPAQTWRPAVNLPVGHANWTEPATQHVYGRIPASTIEPHGIVTSPPMSASQPSSRRPSILGGAEVLTGMKLGYTSVPGITEPNATSSKPIITNGGNGRSSNRRSRTKSTSSSPIERTPPASGDSSTPAGKHSRAKETHRQAEQRRRGEQIKAVMELKNELNLHEGTPLGETLIHAAEHIRSLQVEEFKIMEEIEMLKLQLNKK